MESRELRIGNLFIEEHSMKIIKVIGLEEKRIVFSGMFLDKWQAKPIPLTEEILLKCGFKKDIDDLVLQIGNIILFVSYNDDEFVHCKNMALDNITSIKYLHQLQNLYFALTGEELEVKL